MADGLGAAADVLGDGIHVQALAQQLHDLLFTGRKRRLWSREQQIARLQQAAQLVGHEHLAGHHRAQGLGQFGEVGALVHQPLHAIAQQPIQQPRVARAGQHHHRQRGVLLAQRLQQLGAVGPGAGHEKVGQDRVAGLLGDQVEQPGAIGSRAGDAHLVAFEHDADAVQYDRMVVGDDDARMHGALLGKPDGAPEGANRDSEEAAAG